LIAMLDTDQIRSFLAIVETGAFTKAADRVNKTQSAVSMHIRRLEERLGCALFVKQGRRAVLTEDGERLVDHARRLLHAEAGALAALSRKGLRGQVRLGIPDDYAEAFLADILGRFSPRHPMVEVTAICAGSVDIARQVAAGELDLALITEHEGLHGFECLREEKLVFVASKRFVRPKDGPLPLAMGSPTCMWRLAADKALQSSGCEARHLFNSKNYSAISSVVRAGLAAMILLESMVGPEFRTLGAADGMPELPKSRIGLIFAHGSITPEVGALAEAIRETVAPEAKRKAA
jgi:DNA-binding transcriptional LysR family regulator